MYGQRVVLFYYITFCGLLYDSFTRCYTLVSRPLETGDTFTPAELLPIAKKLISKVEEPGKGKGIVSKSKSPEDLADRLFEAFFLTRKRIVVLKDFDIFGLDALQALALTGEDVGDFKDIIVKTNAPKILRVKGQFVEINNHKKKSVFKVVTKTVPTKIEAQRRDNAILKKLPKKRRIIVNKQRRHLEKMPRTKKKKIGDLSKKLSNSTQSNRKIRKVVVKKVKRKNNNHRRQILDNTSFKDKFYMKSNTTKNSTCRWRYVCSNPADLDTCTLRTYCPNNKMRDDIPVPHKSDEHTLAIKGMRKMLGITFIDEEVEKILEHRVLQLNPGPWNANEDIDATNRLDEIVENFNKLDALESTTPMSWSKISTKSKEVHDSVMSKGLKG